MLTIPWLKNLFLKEPPDVAGNQILPVAVQINTWRKASRKMDWGISEAEFDRAAALLPSTLTAEDRSHGFVGTVLFYGFGDDGCGNADTVVSGQLAWEYALKRRRGKTWQCEYIDFKKPENIRLRPGAPRPVPPRAASPEQARARAAELLAGADAGAWPRD